MGNDVMIDNSPCHFVLHTLPCFRLLRIAMFVAFDSIEGAGIAQVWFGGVLRWVGLAGVATTALGGCGGGYAGLIEEEPQLL